MNMKIILTVPNADDTIISYNTTGGNYHDSRRSSGSGI